MDTRPYRLGWPNSTLIFDVSPERVFRMAAKKLEGAYPLPKFIGILEEMHNVATVIWFSC